MRSKIILVLLLAAITFMPQSGFAQAGKLPKIDNKEYRLKNGLRVVFHQDKSTPVVAVNVWYHVGSKNEATGKTGFAHLFEHMMFQGSKNYDTDYFTPLQEAGGNINGTTNQDRTYYYETVPSNFLELALFLEADRMGGLLEAMTQEKLDNQRDVVKNERRQRVDNQPYGTAFEKIGEIMFPKGHPYNWTTIGSLEDLQAASMDDVKSFFRQYYTPNNAVLVLAGDFDEKQAKKWVEQYFGPIAKGGDITRPNQEMPKLDKEVRTEIEDPLAPLPRRYMAWHGTRQYGSDEAALDMLGNILSSGRGSRLQSNLIYGKEMAQQVGAFNGSNEIAGVFQIQATARPGKSLDDIEKEINAEIERIKTEAPTADEVARARNSIESQTIFGLQTVLGKGGQLSNYAGYVGKPDYFQADLDRYAKVTPADIQRVAKTYLGTNRLVMTYTPKRAAGPATRGNNAANQPTSVKSEKKDQAKIDAQAAKLPKAGPNPKLTLPAIEKTKLSNGLEVWMVEQKELPLISMNLVLKTGSSNEPDDRTGVSGLTTSLLDDGTKTRSAVDIANQLQSIGASVNAGGNWDSTNVSLLTLTKNLDKALEIYADVVTNPIFPATEVESLKARSLIGLRQQKANPNAIANVAYNKVLYGDHPYGRDNTEATLKAITRDDVVKYYDNTFRPNNGVLIAVGDINKADLKAKLETVFAGWKAGEVSTKSIPTPKKLDKTGIYLIDRPNSAQSVVSIGQVGIDRMNPDYFPVVVMNSILGGAITSRISMNLREDKGYTYGANSGYQYRRGAGPFRAGGDIQTAVTKEAIVEFMKELNGIRGSIPITEKELEYNKQSLIRRYPAGFETVGGMSAQLANLVVYGFPESYFNDYIGKINGVTLADVNRAANTYLDPSKMAIVIVGDRKVVEAGLKDLGYPLTILDADGNPVAQ
ncbi:MAG: insulinase family protein [Pyrinomonadaceae bacterium]|nr:insulinase family protein [Pyrinomonadaceae bacterium]MBP6213718.1 insulinase family protein [Pyrinomonadaceae bacterium]